MDLDLLKKIPLFTKLSDDDVRAVGGLLHRQEVPANQPIFYVGERGTSFMILASGQVAIVRPDEEGKEMVVGTLGPGTFFGEISLLDGGPRTATVRTTTDSVLLRLGRDDFLRCLRTHPDLAIHVLEELGRRQRNMLHLLGNVRNANQEMDERLTFGQRVAAACSAGMGSWTFIVVQSVICVLWVLVNVLPIVGVERQWDPYPFNLLALAVTTIAWYAATLIMLNQSRQSQKDRIRADLEYQVNVKAHHEVMQLHQKLDHLSSLLEKGQKGGADAPAAPGR